MSDQRPTGPRSAALIGPYLAGKTTLLESLLFATGATPRKGSVTEGNTVGDGAPEARSRQMSTELNLATTEYLGDSWSFVDCPGSVELSQDTLGALRVVDAAILVVEPEPARAIALAPLFKAIAESGIPFMVFVNKMDTANASIDEVMDALKSATDSKLVLREWPILEGERITGYVDLISLRAYRYKDGAESERIEVPAGLADQVAIARQDLLEVLADFDDGLLEKLLEDAVPDTGEVYHDLAATLGHGQVAPVFFGAAGHDNGVRRLLKALRHEVPNVAVTAVRNGIDAEGEPAVQIFKTLYAAQAGKLSLARVWRGPLADGMTLAGHRIGGLFAMKGHSQTKLAKAEAGDMVALARMEGVHTGALLTASGEPAGNTRPWPEPLAPVFSLAIAAVNRADEVKLTGALQRLCEEDPSLSFRTAEETHEMLLMGQGDIHLQIALDKLKGRYNVATTSHRPSVPYQETIRKSVSQHGRFKRQTGGHGMFGDVHIDIRPLPRGSGFEFAEKVVGGSVPKQYIPAVEAGVKEFMSAGPLGFPVVDVAVTLTDGQYHSVDSNEMSFKLAGRVAMSEGMPKCDPVLLEPILKVDIDVPSDFTNKVHGLVSQRRGQILGFGPKEGWTGWDTLSAHLPQADVHDLIVELRSLTQGVGTYRAEFDHLQECVGRQAENVIALKQAEKTAS